MKNFLNWSPAFGIGIEEIDKQHLILVDIVNSLHLGMEENTEKEGIGFSFDSLDDYVRVHFKTEEKWMVRYAYPDYTKHKKLHQEFANRVSEFKNMYTNAKKEDVLTLATFLKNWFTEHVVFEDHKFGEYLKNHLQYNLVIKDTVPATKNITAPEDENKSLTKKLFSKFITRK